MSSTASHVISLGYDDNISKFNRLHFAAWSCDLPSGADRLLFSNTDDLESNPYTTMGELKSELKASPSGITLIGQLASGTWFLPNSKISGGFHSNHIGGGLRIVLDENSDIVIGDDETDRSVILVNALISVLLPEEIWKSTENIELISKQERIQRVMISLNSGHFLLVTR